MTKFMFLSKISSATHGDYKLCKVPRKINSNKMKPEEVTYDNEAFEINQIPLTFTSDDQVMVNDDEAHATTVQQEVERENPDMAAMIIPRSERMSTSQEPLTEEMFEANHQRERRLERAAVLKQRAIRAVRMKQYERAVIFYSKAISIFKESPVLYNNRAKCYINLKLLKLALEDLKKALRLNPSSLKSGLYLAKIYFAKGNLDKYYRAIANVKMHNPEQIDFINEFRGQLESMGVNRRSL